MLDIKKEPYVSSYYGEHGIRFRTSHHIANTLCFPNHWHEGIEFLQIVSGSLDISLGQTRFTASAGQLVIIMPHTPHHGFVGSQGLVCNMIAFDMKQFYNPTPATSKYLQPIFRREISFCPVTEHPLIIRTVNEMFDAEMQHTAHPLVLQGKLYELLGLLWQHCISESEHFRKPDEKFIEVLTYINSYYTEDISTGHISSKFGYDEAYFCRRFKEITGLTTKQYIRLLRLEMAQELLRTSSEDISSIASRCGYADRSYFCFCFRQQFGITPQEFRLSLSETP